MKQKINKPDHKAWYFTIVYFLLFSFACSAAPAVTVTVTPSITVMYTPSLTYTPIPTVTVQPSATSIPISTSTPLVAGLGEVIFSEGFDDMDFPFGICGAAHIESGILVVERGPEEPSACGIFSGGIYGIDLIPPDATVVVLFKTTSDFNIGLHTGSYQDETLRRFTFGLTQEIGSWDLGVGSAYKTWRVGAPHVDSWYYFSIKSSASGNIDARLWERDQPENMIEFHENLGDEWGTLPLTFVSDFKDVPFLVDEYQVLQ